MSDNLQMWVELIAKLNSDTQDGKLTWTRSTENTTLARQAAISIFSTDTYIAPYREKFFRLTRQVGVIDSKTTFQLEIVDADKQQLAKVPNVVGLSDLYDTVRLHASGLKQFVDDFLGDK